MPATAELVNQLKVFNQMDLISHRLACTKFTGAEIWNYLSWYTNDEVMKYNSGRGLAEQEAKARFKSALKTNASHPDMGFYSVKK